MKSYLINIIGAYVATGDTIAGADWPWIFCAILLVMTLYAFIKMLFGLFYKI